MLIEAISLLISRRGNTSKQNTNTIEINANIYVFQIHFFPCNSLVAKIQKHSFWNRLNINAVQHIHLMLSLFQGKIKKYRNRARDRSHRALCFNFVYFIYAAFMYFHFFQVLVSVHFQLKNAENKKKLCYVHKGSREKYSTHRHQPPKT